MIYIFKKRCKLVEPTSLSRYMIATLNKYYHIALIYNFQLYLIGDLLYEIQRTFKKIA